MNVRMLASGGVALLAGVATFFVAQSMNQEEAPVQVIQPIKEETVRVLVSARDIQRGERLTADDSVWVKWPKKAVQETFITDSDPEAQTKIAEAVARSLIVNGEPIVEQKIVHAGDSGLMAAILSPGLRAVTMRVSPETASGGFILPGDRIDILQTVGRDEKATTKTLYEDVRVVAVNTIYSENSETAHIDGVNVTLELPPVDAEGFITARSNGGLSLVLRSIFVPEGDVVAKGSRSNDVKVIRYGDS